MKLSNINNQNNFKGGAKVSNVAVNFISKHSVGIAGLAATSVIGQKLVMSASEITLNPAMDIALGKVIPKIANDKDKKFEENSKAQAIRSISQSAGGTTVGIPIRAICIGAMGLAITKGLKKSGNAFGSLVTQYKDNAYELTKNIDKWKKSLGGALAIVVMMVTNFLIDVHVINFINKSITDFCAKHNANKKEVK